VDESEKGLDAGAGVCCAAYAGACAGEGEGAARNCVGKKEDTKEPAAEGCAGAGLCCVENAGDCACAGGYCVAYAGAFAGEGAGGEVISFLFSCSSSMAVLGGSENKKTKMRIPSLSPSLLLSPLPL
jgi:hypothetical protein